jgi:signal transduction histidine kinase
VRSLASRITLLMIGTFVIVLLLIVAFAAANRRNVDNGGQLPLPRRVAAIVHLVENTPRGALEDMLAALNAPDLAIRVSDEKPHMPAGAMPMPGVSAVTKAYLSILGGRPARVWLDISNAPNRPFLRRWPRLRLAQPYPVVLVVGLRDGRSMTIKTRDSLVEQFTGLRISLLALLVAIVLCGGVIVILRRQIRPLEQLSRAVQTFAQRRTISLLPVRGAQEIRQLVAAFNEMQSQIVLLIAQRTRMTAAIGHDLGTYLTRLRLRADYIADDDQRTRAIRDIEDMNALMADTLALAKLDQDAEPPEPVDVVATAKRSAARLRDGAHKVTVEAGNDAVFAMGRPTAIGRVFDNLISNAIKYGGACEIALRDGAESIEILVDDHGPGIPAQERSAVLEPFYRLDASRNLDQRGFGLGLAIVADIVRFHQGTLQLDDRPGGGLRVRIELPRAQEPETA